MCRDQVGAVKIKLDISIELSGLVAVSAELLNAALQTVEDGPYLLSALRLSIPLGEDAREVMTVGRRPGWECSSRRRRWDHEDVVCHPRRQFV